MNLKSFLFIRSWMEPIKALDAMEALAFGFIRNEIDRMRHRRKEACRKRFEAAKRRGKKGQPTAMHQKAEKAHEDTHANACNAMHTDAPYDIISESVSESISESVSVSDKKSSTSSGVRVRETAGFWENHLAHRHYRRISANTGRGSTEWSVSILKNIICET